MTRVMGRVRFGCFLTVVALGMSATTVAAQDPTVLPPAQAQTGVLIDSIVVRGNQRVESSVIRVTSALQAGQRVTALSIQNAIRRLMATGNFSDVAAYSEGDPDQGIQLILEVQERP